ncbi:hypothetical protein H8356DRAFT_1618987 [Neocallimastix lanati (nom. inval.)]|nr:hypothetical protein H8356DRAFT_1618987 [Neocallimastix sp. JGI-2020a]
MYYIIFLIIYINMISFNFGKVISYDNEEDNTKNYRNISHNGYLTIENGHNPNISKNESIQYKEMYNSPWGRHCNSGNDECSLEFNQLGPFSYGGFSECYIYDGFSGPDDKQETKGNGYIKIYMDINAKLKCIVNGQTFDDIQRVNILGYSDRLPLLNDFPVGTILNKGSNSIPNSKHVYTIRLSNCTNVWSYRESTNLNCECNKIQP